jgi:gluconokinase
VVVILFGVSGAGKTLVGRLLAQELGWSFYDADTLHATASIEKMRKGVALTDDDRWPWLDAVRDLVVRCLDSDENAVLACSALKSAYRDHLRVDDSVQMVYLKGDVTLIASRLKDRHGHFMDPGLLESQFEALEEPHGEAVVVDVAAGPGEIVNEIRKRLGI